MKRVGEYKISGEKICSGVSLIDCLICRRSKNCSLLREQFTFFDALGVEEVTKILSPGELKYEERRLKNEKIILKFKKRKKFIDQSWNYFGADTKYFTHSFHNYPAMMIPQIAARLLDTYGDKDSTVLDPFCGSGTVLVEAKLRRLHSYGIDINPLALLIAKVKTTPINPKLLQKTTLNLLDKIYSFPLGKTSPPKFFNIEFWFKPSVIKRLSIIKNEIDKIKNFKLKNFFLVAFSETVRDVSNTRNNEFKLYRLSEEELRDYDPDVFKIFKIKILRNINGMTDYVEKLGENKNTPVTILNEDTRYRTSIQDNSINLVITSPPYGDSKTTVAYGQFSRLSLQWLGFSGDRLATDIRSLGGKEISLPLSYYNLISPTLRKILSLILHKDKDRAKDVYRYFFDLNLCLREINRVLVSNGLLCIVIGNRSVKGIRIPTDEIICEFGEDLGLKHIETIIREIPSKRMPSRTSPTNIPGLTEQTMLNEYIIILRKEK